MEPARVQRPLMPLISDVMSQLGLLKLKHLNLVKGKYNTSNSNIITYITMYNYGSTEGAAGYASQTTEAILSGTLNQWRL